MRAGWMILAVVLGVIGVSLAAAQNDSDSNETPQSYATIVAADAPSFWWRLDDGNAEPGDVVGKVTLNVAGPRKDRFPKFDDKNLAAQFAGDGGRIVVKDAGEKSPLDFDAGDSITLEAWVHPTKLANGQTVYVLGKGRTGHAGVAKDNQNYALRLVGTSGKAGISFLFRGASNRPGKTDDWHRWDSEPAFAVSRGWHYVAVTYTFGQKDSLRGYIDGKEVKGKWEGYGGATDEGPVVDDDELWIGSSMGGQSGSSFTGSLDEVAIYRSALAAERIAARYQAVQPKPYITSVPIPRDRVLVEILENIPDGNSWDFVPPPPSERTEEPALGLVELPRKYNEHGVRADRTNPLVVWMTTDIELPAGPQRLLLRSRNAARLYLDGKLVIDNPFPKSRSDGHNSLHIVKSDVSPNIRPVQPGDQENVAELEIAPGMHRLKLELFGGGKSKRVEFGELGLYIAPAGSDAFRLVAHDSHWQDPLTDDGWLAYETRRRMELAKVNQQRRREVSQEYAAYWERRHAWAREVVVERNSFRSEKPGNGMNSVLLDEFAAAAAKAAGKEPLPVTDDWSFVRRVYVDLIGVIPTATQAEAFVKDERPDKRARLIDELLKSPGWADNWVGYWQDVLAENPNIINPTLNNTGPFRWWIYESLLDNKPIDRVATELAMMEGSLRYGGTAGFAMASENDAPMAAKAHILASAFLAMDLRCARCHDAPYHPFKQEDLFSLAALLGRGPLEVPKTSTIPAGIQSELVTVTLKPGQKVSPKWPFESGAFQSSALAPRVHNPLAERADHISADYVLNAGDTREEFAFRLTSPHNTRFAQVVVNRLWHRYLGRGIVEPVDDFDRGVNAHPKLLDFLASELVLHGYDLKHVARLILNSQLYQRMPTSDADTAKALAAPLRRRMSAEQIVDSLFVAAGKQFHVEELNIDVDSGRSEVSSINLGLPMRAWQFTSLSNERDRPALSLPASQTIVNVLEAFGWRGSRQDPVTIREQKPTVLQPAILANGVVGKRISQLSEDSTFTELSLADQPLDSLLNRLYQQILSRLPTAEERQLVAAVLADGYENRRTGSSPGIRPGPYKRDGVAWSNHLKPESSDIKIRFAKEVEKGDPPTTRLTADWRERAEDVVWALVNSPEFVWLP
ncbi:MAG TPA: DUF1553 domain-containing protein [Pirellulaceae bacterium]|nr:DUF1553 domain-containing protein [Pirellulaceae bacterium]